MTDSLSAIKHNVFERGLFTMAELLGLLADNFAGQEALRRRLAERTPRNGNDDERSDAILQAVFEAYYNAVDGRPNTRGGHHRINLLPTTVHLYFGTKLGATPDGRKAGRPRTTTAI